MLVILGEAPFNRGTYLGETHPELKKKTHMMKADDHLALSWGVCDTDLF